MNECMKVLINRRSVKSYKPDAVPQELIEMVTEAGKNAPTGMNRQSPVMVAVTNPATLRTISKLNAEILGTDNDPFYGAPCVIVVFADSTVRTYREDGSLVMGNLLNAASALGLGSCWIHRAKEVFETEEGMKLKAKWGLGDEYVGIGNCIIGYPGTNPAPKAHKEDYVIYDN